jgi:hypothetical protein
MADDKLKKAGVENTKGAGLEVLADLVRKELLSREWAERLLSWRPGLSPMFPTRARSRCDIMATTPMP